MYFKPKYTSISECISDFKEKLRELDENFPEDSTIISYELAKEFNNVYNELKEFQLDEAAADHLTKMRALADMYKKDPAATTHAVAGGKNLVASLRKKAAKEKGIIARGAGVANADKAKSISAVKPKIESVVDKLANKLDAKHGTGTFHKAAQGGLALNKKLKAHDDAKGNNDVKKTFKLVSAKAVDSKKLAGAVKTIAVSHDKYKNHDPKKLGIKKDMFLLKGKKKVEHFESGSGFMDFFNQAAGLVETDGMVPDASCGAHNKYRRETVVEQVETYDDEFIDSDEE